MKSLIEELQAGVYKVRIHCYYRKLLHEIDNYIPKDSK